MPGFHHILFPVDFSEPSQAIVPFVKRMAQRFEAKVSMVHAVHVFAAAYAPFGGPTVPAVDITQMQRDSEQQMDQFQRANDGSFITACPIGDPAFVLREYAQENGVDMVMMPTHGHGTFRTMLLGSLTAKLLHDLECPVWTAAHTADPMLQQHVECRSIICAVDLKPESVCVVKHAVELAVGLGAKMQLVHAVPPAMPGPESYLDVDYRQALTKNAQTEIAMLQKRAGTDLEARIEGDEVSKLVRTAAIDREADLVIIGRGKLHATLGRLRTQAYSIIRDSPCPVLSL